MTRPCLMISQLFYCLNLILSGLALPFVNYTNIGNTVFPILSLIAITSNILIALTMISGSLTDCDPDCVKFTTIVYAFSDFPGVWALDACYILRLGALITDSKQKKYLNLFYIVPVLYVAVDVIVLLTLFGDLNQRVVDIVFGIGNILTPLNSVGLHILLGYHLLYGNAKTHLGEYLQKIHNMTYAISVNMTFALAAGIYATFVPDPGTSLVYFFWTVDVYFFFVINHYLVKGYKVSRSGSVKRHDSNKSPMMQRQSILT
ncbi:hypothetical protein EDD86DRAFT_214025, partial [Gorgonomyces haynaldii]